MIPLTMYRCEACGTVTDAPDWTDASHEVFDPDTGHIRWLRDHLAICPQCHRVLKAFAAAAQARYDQARKPKH